MTIEIRELVIEARVADGQVATQGRQRDRSTAAPALTRIQEEKMVEAVMRRVLRMLRQEGRGRS